MTPIHGDTRPGFEPVAVAFANNFAEHNEVGAHLCVYQHGRPVVDLWGGLADPTHDRPWQYDTVQLMFSVGKGVTATCLLMLVDDGRLDLDAPIAEYWPAFAARGKQHITTRMVMSHRAGLAAIEGELTLQQVFAWQPVVDAIAAQAPVWEPNSQHGYHVRSYGWILGEILRRITGEDIGHWLQQRIAKPLELDLWMGVPESVLPRCASIIPPAELPDMAAMLGGDALLVKAMHGPSNLFRYDGMWNEPDLLKAQMPSSNAVSDARSMARFYAAVMGQQGLPRLLQPETLTQACRTHSEGPDAVIMVPTRFGLGYSLAPFVAAGAGPAAFGHQGAGGSQCFADPEHGISVAYLSNRMHLKPEPDPRSAGLIEALYHCL